MEAMQNVPLPTMLLLASVSQDFMLSHQQRLDVVSDGMEHFSVWIR